MVDKRSKQVRQEETKAIISTNNTSTAPSLPMTLEEALSKSTKGNQIGEQNSTA
jgi:hypothetical protein